MTVTKSIRLTPEELSKWDSKTIHQFLKNGTSGSKTNNKIVLQLLSFLNELKTTFFASESKFKKFSEVLGRYLTYEDLIKLEMSVK